MLFGFLVKLRDRGLGTTQVIAGTNLFSRCYTLNGCVLKV